MCEKYSWDEGTFFSIDWRAHRSAMNCTSLPDRFVTKLTHDMLPAGRRVHKYQPYYDHACPSCGAPYEDRTHFLMCGNENRKKWRSGLTKGVRQICDKMKVDKDLIDLLMDFFEYYFADSKVECARHPEWLHPLIVSQDNIGWEQMFFGRFSKKWSECHETSLRKRSLPIDQTNSGLTLIRRLTLVIWKCAHGEWEVRNKDRHGESSEEQNP